MNKVKSLDELLVLAQELKANNQTIVLTNGCFDLLHPGHVDYLRQAKALGDCLIIALNTDASVKRLKGSARPVIDEKGRARVLAALEVVNYVVLFDTDTPLDVIRKIEPDVLVKGADYEPNNVVGFDDVTGRGGVVRTIPLTAGYSTTSMVTKIKEIF